MYRFLLRPRWIGFHLLVIGAVVVMVNLAFWQLRRLDERKDFNSQVRDNSAAAVVDLDELLPPATTAVTPEAAHDLEWRTVRAAGRYLPDNELRVINRSQGGQAGDVVLTPLRLDDGRVLLVERGFVPFGAEPADAPSGPVEVIGRLRESATRSAGQLTDNDPNDALVPRVDIATIAPRLAGDAVPMYVELVESTPPTAGPPTLLAAPELTNGPHLSYTVQWFIFSLCAIVGWLLAVRRSAAARQTRSSPPADAAEAVPQPALTND